MDYVTKDKLLAEKILGIEFFDTDQRSVFYNGKYIMCVFMYMQAFISIYTCTCTQLYNLDHP